MSATASVYQFDSRAATSAWTSSTRWGSAARQRGAPEELAGLVAWAEQAGVVSKRAAASLRFGRADAERPMARAVQSRDRASGEVSTVFSTHRPVARSPASGSRRVERGALRRDGHARIESRGPEFDLDLGRRGVVHRSRGWPVVRVAVRSLWSRHSARVRECASEPVQLAVHRPESDAAPALVQHEDLREPRQGTAVR